MDWIDNPEFEIPDLDSLKTSMVGGLTLYSMTAEIQKTHEFLCFPEINVMVPNRDEDRLFSTSDCELLVQRNDFRSPVDAIESQSDDICRRMSMTIADVKDDFDVETPTNEIAKPLPSPGERRCSRDIGVQAFSLEIEEEKTKLIHEKSSEKPNQIDSKVESIKEGQSSQSKRRESWRCDRFYLQRPSVYLRRDSCHFHKLISPQNEIIVAHCPGGTAPVTEYVEGCSSHKPLEGGNYIEVLNEDLSRSGCYCYDRDSIESNEYGHRYSTCSSDSSTTTKIAAAESTETMRRQNRCRSSLVYFMDPCIEDSTEYAADDEEYIEKEQSKPLLEPDGKCDGDIVSTTFEKRSSIRKKSVDESKARSREPSTVRNVEGIELANDAVSFGLAENLEKQICIVPSRKKSSGRPSFLKVVTLILIGSAILITSAAIKEAYY